MTTLLPTVAQGCGWVAAPRRTTQHTRRAVLHTRLNSLQHILQ